LLKEKGFTQHELAARTGLDQGYLSRLFRGQSGGTIQNLEDLVEAAGIPADTLMRALTAARREHLKRDRVARVLDGRRLRRVV
jgi:transcriptional regulator with XRE-family HTH domain